MTNRPVPWSWIQRLGPLADRWVYVIWAAVCTLWVATSFFASERLQIHYSWLSALPGGIDRARAGELMGEWSAPLDDVFIHFDFARATARGHPFQWSEGNGYSSGGTSLLYPFVLAVGYWFGFRKLHLVVWAAIVACVSVFGVLLASRRLFAGLPRWTSYVAPPVLLCVGALDWTLFSGMEVAFLLAVWAGAFLTWDALVRRAREAGDRPGVRSLVLGAWCALLVATRPEAVVAVVVFATSAGWAYGRSRGWRAGARVLTGVSAPGVVVVLVVAVANRVLTGDFAAAGALAKLELYHPHLTARQVWDAWRFHLGYQVLRATNYHFSATPGYGWILWGLAAIPLLKRATRRYALLLWGSAALWVAFVALNGQVRWQNERYTMPAVAWLLSSASLGVAVLVSERFEGMRRPGVCRLASLLTASIAGGVFAWQQVPRFREQIWFFGRASRNIHDQHVLTGRLLRRLAPPPHRVLVGDAGAIPYASDLPSLDIIGLGGFAKLPFARATRWGVPAAIELIERMPRHERPDVLALYPSWWGDLPLWFGDAVARIPVRGNVICGGTTKVVYRPDWRALDESAAPSDLQPGEVVADSLDFADVVSEREHDYQISRPATGFLAMKLLPNPARPELDLWDAGRILPEGVQESFRLRRIVEGRSLRLVFRTAPAQSAEVSVVIDGVAAGRLVLDPTDGWRETSVSIPSSRVRPTLLVRLRAVRGERVLYHLWAVQPK